MPARTNHDDIRRLRMDVEWAIRQAMGPEELMPMLRRLANVAPPDSDDFSFAHRHMAELNVEKRPWQAALSARQVVSRAPDDDRAWAVLGLSFTMLGHYRAAASAYRRAMTLAPANPWYAHNLGHLVDVALNRPFDALPLLAGALKKEPREVEIASSYAHALARAGRVEEAKKLLRRYIKTGGTTEQKALMKWLEKGAPEDEDAPPPRRRRARAKAPGAPVARKGATTKPAPH